MPSRVEVAAYSQAQNLIVTAAKQRLNALWLSLGDSVWEAGVLREALSDVMPALVADFGDAAATLAAEWFEQLVDAPALLADTAAPAQVLSSADWAMGPLFEQNPAQVLSNLGLVLDRLVKQPGRDTIQLSALSVDIGWARVPSGAKTCAFCLMLASRGAVYASEESALSVTGVSLGGMDYRALARGRSRADIVAGRKPRRNLKATVGEPYHADCDCTAIPVQSPDDFPSGYDPGSLFEKYADARAVAGGDTKKILAEMRAQLGVS